MKNKLFTMSKKIMLFGAFCFMVLVSLTAEAKKPGNVKWATTYMKIIHKMNKEDKNKNYSNLPYKYGLIYFDKDNIPELVVSGEYWTSMYTYDKRKKKAYKVMGKSGYGMHVLGYDYLPGKNVLRSYSKHSNGAISYIYFGKMKNHKIVSRYPKSLKMLMFDDKNKNGILDSNELPGKNYYYYYGNKEISKKEFDSYEIAGKYKPVTGSLSYKKMKRKLIAKGAAGALSSFSQLSAAAVRPWYQKVLPLLYIESLQNRCGIDFSSRGNTICVHQYIGNEFMILDSFRIYRIRNKKLKLAANMKYEYFSSGKDPSMSITYSYNGKTCPMSYYLKKKDQYHLNTYFKGNTLYYEGRKKLKFSRIPM